MQRLGQPQVGLGELEEAVVVVKEAAAGVAQVRSLNQVGDNVTSQLCLTQQHEQTRQKCALEPPQGVSREVEGGEEVEDRPDRLPRL